jgi:hypothetical protein
MDKQLPLTVTTKVSRYAVHPDAEFKTFALADAAAKGSIGEAILAEVRLANDGPADLAVKCVLADDVAQARQGNRIDGRSEFLDRHERKQDKFEKHGVT